MRERASRIHAVLSRGVRPAITTALALLPTDAPACSVCVSWTEGQGLNGGFYWSALLLTTLPFAVVAVIGAWVGYAVCRARPRQAPGTAEPAAAEKR